MATSWKRSLNQHSSCKRYSNRFDEVEKEKERKKIIGWHVPFLRSLELSLLVSLISIFATPAGVQTSTGGFTPGLTLA